jgi:DNA-binding CsgD family transcriptional regulator/tetratricopeptide (TPR) repeat protein
MSVICPVVIGRSSELAALDVLLDQGKSGKGQVVLLSGEAGVGKSRLIAEVKTTAARMGFLALQGNCFQADHTSSYAPILEMLRSSSMDLSRLLRNRHLLPFAQEFSQMLSDTTTLESEQQALVGSSSLDPQQAQHRLFVEMLQFLTEQATQQPLLCILEDLHWSDEPSLELLVYLARKCTHLPILFVLTYRSDEVSPELRHCLAALDREHLARDFFLQRLTRAEVDAMLQAIFVGQQAISADLLESLYALTEGNPFFVEEMLKSLLITGELTNQEGVWERTSLFGAHARHPAIPRSIQDAVYQRITQVSNTARQVLTLAAVAGRHFDLSILQRVLRIDEATLLTSMKELVEAQLVKEETAERFSFRHALTREAVSSGLLAGERRVFHRTLAETIERDASLTAALDTNVEDLAYHYYEGGVWSKAVEYAQRAAERAHLLLAPRAAIEHQTRALDALSRLGANPPASMLHQRGQDYATIGAFEQALSDYEQALSLAREHRNGALEWQCLLDLGFLWAGRDYTRAGQWFRASFELAQGLDDATSQARSLNRVGNWLVNTGQVADGLQAHREALAIVELLGDGAGLAETLDLLAMANGIFGDNLQAVEQYDRAILTLRALNDQQGLISSLTSRAAYASPGWAETTPSTCEPLEHSLRDLTEALSLARQVDSMPGQAFSEWLAGLACASFGELGQGLAHARESLRIATRIQHTQWLAAAYFTLGRVYLMLLESNLAVQALEEGLAFAKTIGSAWWIGNISAYLARAYLAQGKPQRAEAALQAVMTRGQQPANSVERRVGWAWGELALAHGEAEVALGIAEQLLASTPGTLGTLGTLGASEKQPIPWLLKLKGEALGALSRREEAIHSLEAARSGALMRHERPTVWQIDQSLGRCYRRLKQDDLSRRHFALAREGIMSLAETVGGDGLREHFLQIALSTLPRGKAVSPNRAAKAAFGGLTERERAVMRLVAEGKTNHEIAGTLVVTKRTIETHINNITHKLALTSRAQLVVWAIEHGLLPH